ncbi:Rab8 [Tritrichomonas foetus]|uniref:Rab8 n=1 Tax=Tritrichomonas foetus TaxID=1144522 RepID=A0A1J4KYB2_9EUKA|nr:Rab8 [Tritrichomonas foetus]|eukprot:OHT16154.1 Rab8 [Tritrichomonas foetus]
MTVDDKPVTLQVWNTTGQEMYRALVPVYLKGAHAAIVFFDITDFDSFNSLGHWYDLLRDTVSESTPVFLVANKTDHLKDITSNTINSSPNNNNQINDSTSNDSNVDENRSSNSPIERSNFVDDESAKTFAVRHSSKFFRVSALTGEGVDEIFQAVAKEMARATFTDATVCFRIFRLHGIINIELMKRTYKMRYPSRALAEMICAFIQSMFCVSYIYNLTLLP